MDKHVSKSQSLIELLQAVRDGNHCARDAFASMLFPILSMRLRARFAHIESDMCDTAAGDSVTAILDRPDSFDPCRNTFDGFVWGVAKRKLNDLVVEEQRLRSRSKSPKSAKFFSELDDRETEYIGSEKDNPAAELERRENDDYFRAQVEKIRETMTKEERETLDLILQEIHDGGSFEAIFSHLTNDRAEIYRMIKCTKARVMYRLRSIKFDR